MEDGHDLDGDFDTERVSEGSADKAGGGRSSSPPAPAQTTVEHTIEQILAEPARYSQNEVPRADQIGGMAPLD